MPLLRQVNRAIFVWQFCKPSILKRPSRFSVGLHGLIDDEFSVDSNLILFHLKFLALNEPEYYEALSGEAKRSSTGGSKLWAAGFEGLRQRVSEVNHAGASLPVMEPQKAAIGCYSMDQSRLKPEARVAGNPFRVAGEGSSSAFALPERWLDLV